MKGQKNHKEWVVIYNGIEYFVMPEKYKCKKSETVVFKGSVGDCIEKVMFEFS